MKVTFSRAHCLSDILYVSEERASIVSERNIQGTPDLLVEILSEGNRRHDEVGKRKLYESFGVQEYWNDWSPYFRRDMDWIAAAVKTFGMVID